MDQGDVSVGGDPGRGVSVDVEGSSAIAHLRGEIDREVREELLDELTSVLPTIQRMDIDLGQVTFMDSSGLSLLVHIQERARAGDATVRLVNVPPRVVRLLSLTALDAVFVIV